VKFWKWMRFKVEQNQVVDWFDRHDSVSKGQFAMLMNKLEWHCNNSETGSELQGEQLNKKQIKHLLKCVVGVEKEVTVKMVEEFAAIENPEGIKAALQKHHNALGKTAQERKRTKQFRQDKEDGTTARVAAAVARGDLMMSIPVLHQIFGLGQMLSAHSTHSIGNNKHTDVSKQGKKYLHADILMKGVLVPVALLEIHCESMELHFKIAGVPMVKHLRSRGDGMDVLFYEALSRAIWGTESLCCCLGYKVQLELEEHADWYRERVGVCFFGCVTGIWPALAESSCCRPKGITGDDDHSMYAQAGDYWLRKVGLGDVGRNVLSFRKR
jgi:hypothetical protein